MSPISLPGPFAAFYIFYMPEKKSCKGSGNEIGVVISNLKAPFSLIGWAIFLFHFWILLTFVKNGPIILKFGTSVDWMNTRGCFFTFLESLPFWVARGVHTQSDEERLAGCFVRL